MTTTRALLFAVVLAGAAMAQIPLKEAEALPSYKSLKYPPLKSPKIPEPVTFTLPNGMKVYLLEDHELPLVSGFALVRTGNLFDPPEKRGLSEVTGTVLRTGGTKSKTGDQLDVQLENIAASVESGMGETSASVSFSGLRENTTEILGVFRDVLTNPEFRQDKVDLAKDQYRSSIARRNDDPGGVASREFASLIYGKDTPYGWNIEYETLDRISRDDLIAFYKRYYFPANIRLAIYGDFSTADLKAQLEKLFADWTYQQPEVPPFPPVTAKPAPGIYLAEKEDVTQTFFEVGQLGGLLKDKDYPALQVAADILGSGFTSRLMQKVRTQLGYAYSIGAGWDANYDHPGFFEISGSTKSQSTEETLAVIRQEVERMRAAEVTPEELSTAKDRVLNSFVFFFDRPSRTLNRLVTYEYYGYPKDFIFDYQKAVQAVTRADVLRVVKQNWKPENLTIVAVGNPKDFGTPLAKLGLPVNKLDLTIPEPKKSGPAKADAAGLERGKELLARVQKAMGGADKLASVRDLTAAVQVSLETGAGTLPGTQLRRFLMPGYMRNDQQLPFGKLIVYSDGKTGWISGPQGLQPLAGPVLRQMQGQIFRELVRLVQAPNGETVNSPAEGVLEISNQAGHSVRLDIDGATGLPSKLSYQGEGAGQVPAISEALADWRDVGGIKLPFQTTTYQGTQKAASATVTECKINTGLTVDQLSKKP